MRELRLQQRFGTAVAQCAGKWLGHSPSPDVQGPPSPPPGQLVFNGVQAGFEPEVEDAVNKFGEDIEGAEGARR